MAKSQTSQTLAILIGNPGKKHKVEAYEKLTQRINQIAKREDRPWTWRYVQSVQAGSLKPSRKFIQAVSQLKIPTPPAPLSPRWWRCLRRSAIRAMAQKTRQEVLRKVDP